MSRPKRKKNAQDCSAAGRSGAVEVGRPEPTWQIPFCVPAGETDCYSVGVMLDDGTLSSEEAQKYQCDLGLRMNHIGLSLPGQVLRLDLYRLVCYFQTSEYLADLSDGGDFCPWQGLRDEFQDSEIMRILLQTAVAGRDRFAALRPALRRTRSAVFLTSGIRLVLAHG